MQCVRWIRNASILTNACLNITNETNRVRLHPPLDYAHVSCTCRVCEARVQHEDELVQGNTKEASATCLCEWQRTMKNAVQSTKTTYISTQLLCCVEATWSRAVYERVGVCVSLRLCGAITELLLFRRAVNRLCYELMLIWILPDAAKRYHRSANWVQFSRKRRVSHCSLCLQHTQIETQRKKKYIVSLLFYQLQNNNFFFCSKQQWAHICLFILPILLVWFFEYFIVFFFLIISSGQTFESEWIECTTRN